MAASWALALCGLPGCSLDGSLSPHPSKCFRTQMPALTFRGCLVGPGAVSGPLQCLERPLGAVYTARSLFEGPCQRIPPHFHSVLVRALWNSLVPKGVRWGTGLPGCHPGPGTWQWFTPVPSGPGTVHGPSRCSVSTGGKGGRKGRGQRGGQEQGRKGEGRKGGEGSGAWRSLGPGFRP